jgi:uncharacterized protein (TIGR03437 family)
LKRSRVLKGAILSLLIISLPLMAQTPTLSQFVSGVESSFAGMRAEVQGAPPHAMQAFAHWTPLESQWLGSQALPPATQYFDTAIAERYADTIATKAGITTFDLQPWALALSSSSQYQNYCNASTMICIPSDCPNGPRCAAVATYDQTLTYAHNKGYTINLQGIAGTGNKDLMNACAAANVNPAWSTTPGQVNEAGFEACTKPLYYALIERYGSGLGITGITIEQEPTCGSMLMMGNTLSVSDWHTYAVNIHSVIRSINPTILIGATGNGVSCGWLNPAPYDEAYVTDWVTPANWPGGVVLFDFFDLDYFAGQCDPSNNNYQLDADNVWKPYYFVPLLATGKPLYIGQTQMPFWCNDTGTASNGVPWNEWNYEKDAYLGTGNVVWQTSGVMNDWASTLLQYAAGNGLSGVGFWCPLWLLWESNSTVFDTGTSTDRDSCGGGSYSAEAVIMQAQWPSLLAANLATDIKLLPLPVAIITAVANGGSFQPVLASATWVSIYGTNLALSARSWQAGDFVNGLLPTSLNGVSVTINGKPAYVEYISPTQINALAPDDSAVGAVTVQVTTTAQSPSNSFTVQKQQFAPAWFTFANGKYLAALHTNYSYVGASGLIPGVATTPAQPGEVILLYGTGFGTTNPATPTDQLVTQATALANSVQITIGGIAASVQFAGLTESGLYQFNVVVPNLPNGDAAVVAQIGGVKSAGVAITVQQ